MWIQQDGARPHYTIQARNHLNDIFENDWIGRAGLVNWPIGFAVMPSSISD